MRVQFDPFRQRVTPICRAFCHSFDNGLPRSIGHGRRRRLTNRQAFSLGVIDLFSVCIEEHLPDCGIVVIHVLEKPLLGEPLPGRGLCEGLDISLREEVVYGLITCVGEGFVRRHHLLTAECTYTVSYYLASWK